MSRNDYYALFGFIEGRIKKVIIDVFDYSSLPFDYFTR